MQDDPLRALWFGSERISEDRRERYMEASRGAGIVLELVRSVSELQERCARKAVNAVILSWSEMDDADAVAHLACSLPQMPVVVLTRNTAHNACSQVAAVQAFAQETSGDSNSADDALAHAIWCAVARQRSAPGDFLRENAPNPLAWFLEPPGAKALVDHLAVGMILTDVSPQASILRANAAFEDLLGYSRRQLVGTPVAHITHLDDCPRDSWLYRELMRGTCSNYQIEKRFVRPGGDVVWAHASVSLIRDTHGRPLYTVRTVTDLSARKQAERAVHQLQREIFDFPLEERRRLSRELHEELAQELTGLSLQAKAIARNFAARSMPFADVVQQFVAATQRMIGRVHAISRELVPKETDSNGLVAALYELAESTRRTTGIECRFRCEQPVEIHDPYVAHHLYRMTQEAVDCVVKHGSSSRIRIAIEDDGERIELSVKTIGSPLGLSRTASEFLDLEIIQYRANLVGAVLCVAPQEADTGTVITCTLRKDGTR